MGIVASNCGSEVNSLSLSLVLERKTWLNRSPYNSRSVFKPCSTFCVFLTGIFMIWRKIAYLRPRFNTKAVQSLMLRVSLSMLFVFDL